MYYEPGVTSHGLPYNPFGDRHIKDGRIDVVGIRPPARVGYHDYTTVDTVFTMSPAGSAVRLAGLEGSPEKMTEALRQVAEQKLS